MAAQNIPPRELSKRQPQKKKYDDYICEKNSKINPKSLSKQGNFPCSGCEIIHKNKKALLLHQATCLTSRVDLSKQGSFFNQVHIPARINEQNTLPPLPTEEKVLPPSQPLEPLHDEPPNSDDAVVPEAVVFLTENRNLFPIHDTDVQDDEEVPIENVSPVEEMLFMDQTIRANLPDFTTVPTVPNQDYNNVDKVRFATTINAIYEDTLHWRKNLFLVPTGKSGKEYIKLKTEWLNKTQGAPSNVWPLKYSISCPICYYRNLLQLAKLKTMLKF